MITFLERVISEPKQLVTRRNLSHPFDRIWSLADDPQKGEHRLKPGALLDKAEVLLRRRGDACRR